MRRLAAMVAIATLAIGVLCACEPTKAPTVVHHSELRPAFQDKTTAVSSGGGRVEYDGVRVDVPALTSAKQIEVSTGRALGRTNVGYMTEQLGAPVRIDHDGPLQHPVTITWAATGLNAAQASRAFLVRWDEQAAAWKPSSEPVRRQNGALVARVSRFSTIDWSTDLGQQLGELVGARADPPTCSRSKPNWVDGTVAADGGNSAAAALMCFESGADDRTLVLRVVNNRTFAQRLTLSAGATGWSKAGWKADGIQVKDVAYSAFHTAIDRYGSVIVPPGTEVVAELPRPATAGPVFISGRVQTQPITVLADAVAYSLGQASIGGTENPILDAFLQAIYECGGKAGLSAPAGAAQMAKEAVDTLGSCTGEIARPDSEFGRRFEELSRTAIAKSSLTQKAAIQANRAVEHLSRAFAILTAGEVVTYLSDQFATALVGPLPWSVRGRGAPAALGSWTATCRSTTQDSSVLYKNLTLQDQFADTGRDYWQFPGWSKAAAKAVQPLAKCAPDYRSRLATFLPTDWADATSAKVVARAIRDLSGPSTSTVFTVLRPWTDKNVTIEQVAGAADCFASGTSERGDAWRCSSASQLSDPCFANAARSAVRCVDVDLRSYRQYSAAHFDAPPGRNPSGRPFGLILADGNTCFASSGAGPRPPQGFRAWLGGCTAGSDTFDDVLWGDPTSEDSSLPYPDLFVQRDAKGQLYVAVGPEGATPKRLAVRAVFQ